MAIGILAAATLLSIGFAVAAAALPTGAQEQPEGTEPWLDVEGVEFYIPAGETVEGIPPELLEELRNLSPEQREDAIQDQYLTFAGQAPQAKGDGSSLTGEGGASCGGWAYSFDDNNVMIDSAYDAGDNGPPVDTFGDGGQAFTQDNPFKVHNNGSVLYMGFANPPPTNHNWTIKVSAFGQDITVDKGGDENAGEHNRNIGFVDLGQDFPLKINFTAQISAKMTADDGWVCEGSGWVEVVGENNPIVAFAAGIGALAGLAGILFNARPARSYKG